MVNPPWRQRIDQIVDEHFDQLVALRRHLHAHPEPSGEEFETSLRVYQLLADRGMSVRMGPEGRGVLVDGGSGENISGTSTTRVAIRGDIDALRIADEKQASYASTHEGVMHACGHDAHTTCAVGALIALDELAKRGEAPGPLAWRGIFQPSEETATGAAEMVDAGAAEGVDAFLALHVDPRLETGTIGVRPGVLTAFAEMLRIDIHGAGGHAARPHESRDPIAAAAQLISTIYQYIPRATDSQETVVVTIGQITGGATANVIPEHVTLRGTVRTLDPAVRERTLDTLRHLCHGVSEITGTRVELDIEVSLPSVDNDPRLAAAVESEAADLLGKAGVQSLARPSMGSEDFAVFGRRAPLAMFRLGCAANLPGPGLHTTCFDIDERCLAVGAKLLARTAVAVSLNRPKA
ncbi:MAG: amidohydrolase [Planctomycetota bacterium]